jgi:hypothetical protein
MSERDKNRSLMERGELVSWLEQALVPVSPNPTFVRRLRGRIVTYHRGALPSQWTLVFVALIMLALIAASLGMAIRLLLGLLGLFGLMERGRRERELEAGAR